MADLTTLAAAKLYSGVQSSADDALIGALISSYSEWVQAYTNCDFEERDYSIWTDGRDNQSMLLPQRPITGIESLMVSGISIPQQATFGSYGYRFDDDSITLDGAIFVRGKRNIHINYSAGYAIIPPSIAQAVNELVGLRYALRDKQGWTSKSLAGETVSLSTKDMPSSVKTVLDQYRTVIMA